MDEDSGGEQEGGENSADQVSLPQRHIRSRRCDLGIASRPPSPQESRKRRRGEQDESSGEPPRAPTGGEAEAQVECVPVQ